MRPANSSSSSEIWRWNSPFPYLFGGLALILGLIVVALIILSCSHKKRTSSPDHDKDKVIVIMAGDENPTYLATPVPAATTTASDEQV
ncbi:hypothetical protein PVL29_018839 [Vitis rotundifolia]|uniref:Uncharacterized protein n=1 Tax=Vitis rotundifolia TaxID=103349 RepID=A0AA38Z6Z1_VITRO|nr:hypothetical protein PVL29_018839 [Vitis rotundifolia]